MPMRDGRYLFTAGIDEAGRGPLAGPVTAAAVVLPEGYRNPNIIDSKKLNGHARANLFVEITSSAVAHAVVSIGPREIEQINIREATRQAMSRAAAEVCKQLLVCQPDARCHFMVDGNMPLVDSFSCETIVKGDQLILCISAASILAKVTRDRLMAELDLEYPGYGLAVHKGYPTKQHREKIKELGPTEIHRRTFAGVREYL